MGKVIYCVFILFLFVSWSSAEFEVPDYMKNSAAILHSLCLEKSGASIEVLQECQHGIIPDDPKVKCYLDCIYETIDVFDSNGHVNLTLLKVMVPEAVKHLLTTVGAKCSKISGSDRCDTAYLTSKCYLESHEDIIQFCHLFVF